MNSHVNPLMAGILNSFAHGIRSSTDDFRATGNHLAAQNDEREPGDLTAQDVAEIDASFAPRAACSIKRESTGCGMSDSTTLVCACGGFKFTAYEYQNDKCQRLESAESAHLARGGK